MNIFDVILIQPLTNGLILFYKILGHNLGLAIIGFTLFLRFILSPLTKSYLESMKKIKEAEPQLNKLKKKYQNDKTKLMKAQADFYKEKGINPGGGCLPYLLQIVVLIALFNVFMKILIPGDGNILSLNNYLYPPLKFKTEERLTTRFLYLDLTKPDIFKIPGLPFPLPGAVLFLAAVLQLITSIMVLPVVNKEVRLVKKTESKEDDIQIAMQKSTIYTFPFFTLIFGMKFSAGLALYWAVFSAFQLVQQYQISGWGGLTPLTKGLKLGNQNEKR